MRIDLTGAPWYPENKSLKYKWWITIGGFTVECRADFPRPNTPGLYLIEFTGVPMALRVISYNPTTMELIARLRSIKSMRYLLC